MATGIEVLTPCAAAFTCPVIIVTGTGNEHVAVEAIKAGVTDYVVKPVGFTRLPYAIQAALLTMRNASSSRLPTLETSNSSKSSVLRKRSPTSCCHNA